MRHIPLTPQEHSFWLSEQVSGKHNHTAVAFVLGTSHDSARLSHALHLLIAEQPRLRARIVVADGTPCWQEVGPDEWPRLAVSDCPDEQHDAAFERFAHTPFRLDTECACRFMLLRGRRRHLLMIVLHHVTSEVHTVALLCARLSALYAAADATLPSPAPLQSLPVHATTADDAAYWQHYVEQHHADPLTPYFPPSAQAGRITTRQFSFGLLAAQVADTCREQAIGPFRLLAAAWGATLLKVFGQSGLWLNYPVSLRTEVEADVMATFVADQVLHVGADDATTARQMVDAITADRRAARPHQHAALLQTAVGDVLRQEHQSALFNFPLDRRRYSLTLDGEHIPLYKDETTYMPCGLQLDVEGDLSFGIVYACEQYPSFFAPMLADAFCCVLSQMVHDVDTPLSRLVLCPQHDTFNGPVVPVTAAEADLAARFADVARRHAADVAVVSGDEQATFAQLDRWATGVARLVAQTAGRREDASAYVGVFIGRNVCTPAVLLGIWRAGYAYIPLDPENPAERMAHILQDSRPGCVVCQRDLMPQLAAMQLPDDVAVVSYEEALEAAASTEATEHMAPTATEALPDRPAYMMYTSGTTGHPKGAPVTLGAVAAFIDACADHAPVRPGDRQMCFNSIAFDLSVWDMFCPLMAGATVVMASESERRDPRLLLRLADEQQVTHMIVAPAMMSQTDYCPLPHLRYLVLSGEASPLDTVRRWLPVGHVLNGYGPTENTIVCNIHTYLPDDDCATNIGPSLRGTTGYVLDEQRHLVPLGVKGELCVGGRQLTRGYHHRPELNAERFMPNPFASDDERQHRLNDRLYATGDVAYRMPQGDIVYCGRRDSQVKINGHRIELGEIAARIEQYTDVAKAAVIVADRGAGRQLHAFVETASGALDRRALRQWLEGYLPLFMLPASYTLVEHMPMNVNRKVDQRALQALLLSDQGHCEADDTQDDIYHDIALHGSPLQATQRALADIWVPLLGGNTHFTLTDNFLSLGGSSIAIIAMVQLIERQLGVGVSVASVYSHPTIDHLSTLVGNIDAAQQADALGVQAELTVPPHLHSLLLHCALSAEASQAYNLSVALPVPDGATPEVLLWAWNMLRQLQDALRMGAVIGNDGRPHMQVTPYEPLAALPQQHYTSADDLERLQREQTAQPWPFDGRPLCRLVYYTTPQGRQPQLRLYIHHLVTDGWSLWLARQQFVQLVQALMQQKPDDIPLPLHTYREYCRQAAATPTPQATTDYWEHYLSDFDDIRLPYTAATGDTNGLADILPAPLPPDTTRAVQDYCEKHELTLFAFYASAYMIVLARLCQQTGFVVGYPSAGRHDARYTDVMGYFVHTLPLRFTAQRWDDSFPELCRHTMTDARRAADHLADFALLADIAARQGYTDPTMPLIQAMFTLDEHGAGMVADNAEAAQFPLTLTVALGADGQWTALWKYATARLAADSVALMSRCYATLIDHILQAPDSVVARLTMVRPDEQRAILARNTIWPLTTPANATIVSLLRDITAQCPHPWMLKDKHGAMTYAEVDQCSDRLARALLTLSAAQHHATPGGPFTATGHYMLRSKQAVVAMIGIMKAGHVYVPLDITYPADRIRTMVSDSQMQCIVCQRELLPQLQAMQLPEHVAIVCYDDAVASHDAPHDSATDTPATVWPHIRPEDPAYMIYTSGTTGKPKGVVITHANVVALARIGGQGTCNPTADDIVLQFNSYIFDASINDIFSSLLNGARLFCVGKEGRRDPDLLFRQMEEERVTYACIPPALLQGSGKEPTSALRTLLCGGETPSDVVVQRYTRHGTMLNGYGPSENTVVATVNDYRQSGIYTANCIGRQLPGVSCYVLDDHLNLVPPGCPGQLYLGGLQLSPGYHRQPELNSRHFTDNPYVAEADRAHHQNTRLYATGDVVTQDEQGHFFFIGRKDFQVKLRGHRIELADIESTLQRHSGVEHCVVMMVRRGVADQLAAYLACDTPLPTAEQLRDYAAAALPPYMVPTLWHVAEALPLTINGKVDRRRLATLPITAIATTADDTPMSEEEKKYRSIVARVMQVSEESISPADDLIEQTGMNSLFVLELVHQLRTRGYDLHPIDVYRQRTIRRLVDYANSATGLTKEQTDRRLCYLANDDDPAKPLLVVVCGYRYYEVNYGDLHRALKDRYTLLVLESAIELQSYRPECAATADAMISEYVRLLTPYIRQRPIAAITGLCIGGDIALQLAVRLDELHLGQPVVFVIDGMADRPAYRGNTGIMEGAGISQETDRQRKDYIISFSKTLHQRRYNGRVHLFMATQFESVEKFTEQEARQFFPVNRDNWQRLQPGIVISYYDCVHMQLIHDQETLRQMTRIIDNELTDHQNNP